MPYTLYRSLQARKGHIDAARLLLQLGADVNKTDAAGRNALHHAVVSEVAGEDLVEMLVRCLYVPCGESSAYLGGLRSRERFSPGAPNPRVVFSPWSARTGSHDARASARCRRLALGRVICGVAPFSCSRQMTMMMIYQ